MVCMNYHLLIMCFTCVRFVSMSLGMLSYFVSLSYAVMRVNR